MTSRLHGLRPGGCLVLAWALAGCVPPAGAPPRSSAPAAPVAAAPQAPAPPPAADDRRADDDIDKLIHDLGGKDRPQPRQQGQVTREKEQPRQEKDPPPPGDRDGIDTVIKKHGGKTPAEVKGQPRQETKQPGQEQEPPGQADVVAWVKSLEGDVDIDAEQPGRPVVGIDLSHTRVADNDLARLQRLPHLRTLNLDHTNISDAGLKSLRGLSGLEELYLSATDVTDAGLAHLRDLSNLRELDLDASLLARAVSDDSRPGRTGEPRLKITDAGLVHLKGLTNLERLNLDSSEIMGTGLGQLAGLSKLQYLNLSGSKVTSAGLAHLPALGNLQELDLSETGVTDAGLAPLKRLPGLETLDLSTTAVTDAGLPYLRALPRLKELGVLDTKVTPVGLARNGLARAVKAFEDKYAGDFLNTPDKPEGGKPDAPPDKGSPPPRPATPANARLPRYFDQLDLTGEQAEKVSRTAKAYDDRIDELKQKLDRARRVPFMTGMIIGLANAIKKLTNERQQALEDLLTDDQRDKLEQLRAGK